MTESERDELVKKCEARLRTALQSISDAQTLLAELRGKPVKAVKERDENGEPTWEFSIKVKIPSDIYLTKAFTAYAAEWGFNANSADILFNGAKPDSGSDYSGFKAYYIETGTKWQSWTKTWQRWVRSEHERKTKAAQRVGQSTRFDQQRTRT